MTFEYRQLKIVSVNPASSLREKMSGFLFENPSYPHYKPWKHSQSEKSGYLLFETNF